MFMVLLSILGIISEATQHFESWNGSCNRFGYYGNDIKEICGLLLFPYLNNLCENQLSRVKRAKSIINLECKRLITIILSSVKVDTKIFIRRILCDMTVWLPNTVYKVERETKSPGVYFHA